MKLALPDFKRIILKFQEEKKKSNLTKIGVDENVRYKYINKKILQNEFEINRRRFRKNNNKEMDMNNFLDKTEDTENKDSDPFFGNLKDTENSFEVIKVENKNINDFINKKQTPTNFNPPISNSKI